MSRHRGSAPKRRAVRARPRWARIALLATAMLITGIAVGSAGTLWLDRKYSPPAAQAIDPEPTAPPPATVTKTVRPAPDPRPTNKPRASKSSTPDAAALPADSGSGYRVVFSESEQRIWLVNEQEEVVHTHLGSGSVYDNLDPGTYEVYSRSEQAVGIDGSTMELFVRFTKGNNNAAIGFHTIPELNGEPVQTPAELGTPLSHGCIRQLEEDAQAVWEFAPIGTTVVVVA